MQTVRELVSVFWTMVNVALIASFVWFLWQSRKAVGENDALARAGAIALSLIFAGSLASQLYMLLVMALPFEGQGEITPYFPVAVIALALASTGGVWSIWLFRPRNVPAWMWLTIIIGIGVILAVARVLVF